MSDPPAAPRADRACGPMQPITRVWFIALLGWTALLSFYQLEGGAHFEPIDCWVAQTAREMLDADDWLIPRFSGETRMQKSPGPYWAVMLTSLLRGTPVDEVSARIPNALAAIALVATIFWLARRIAGDRAAVFAGFAASSSVLVLWWSHRGASDLGLATFTAISLAALWVAAEHEPPGRKRNVLWLVGYAAAGLGMLYKMPMPVVIVGLPALAYVLIRNRWRVLADRIHLFGLAVFLLPWLPWTIAVVLAEPNALLRWKVEFWDRFTGNLPNVSEQRAWHFHLVYLLPPLIYCLPFTLSLPNALIRGFRKQPGVSRDGTLFMLVWFLSHFAFFTAAAGKELRYFLPALPPLLVLLGIELSAFFDPRRRAAPRRDRLGALAVWTLVPLFFVGGIFGLYHWYKRVGALEHLAWSAVWPPYVVTAIIFAGGAALAAWLYLRRREHASFGMLVATMYATWLWVWPHVMPMVASQRPFLDFAQQLTTRIEPGLRDRLHHIGSQDARIIWYSDCRFPRLIDQLDLLEMQGGSRSLEHERQIYGEEMVERLSDAELVLLVAMRRDYVDFLTEAPAALSEQGRLMPPVHLWLQTGLGSKSRQFVIFSNHPPPWPEPELTPPSERLEQARRQRDPAPTPGSSPPRQDAPTSHPAAHSASQPASDG